MAVLCLLVFLASSCRKPVSEPPVEPVPAGSRDQKACYDPGLVKGERALEAVRGIVAFMPRNSATAGAGAAAQFLASKLREIGVKEVEIDEFEDDTPEGKKIFRNVTGRLPGASGRLIVLGSHYDTAPGMDDGFQGANDSGSSTGLLLELASVLCGSRRGGMDILFAFFDGEECVHRYGRSDGLHGSKHLAAKLVESGKSDKVRAVIILDMVGDRDLTVGLPRNSSPELCAAVFKASRKEGARSKFSLGGVVLDDHIPFMQAGIPAVDIIDFEFGSGPGLNDYWHTLEDNMDKLSAESLETVGRVVIRLINQLEEP